MHCGYLDSARTRYKRLAYMKYPQCILAYKNCAQRVLVHINAFWKLQSFRNINVILLINEAYQIFFMPLCALKMLNMNGLWTLNSRSSPLCICTSVCNFPSYGRISNLTIVLFSEKYVRKTPLIRPYFGLWNSIFSKIRLMEFYIPSI